ncbi:hypothetical protein SVAN01_01946 [Stagonosporopsis vannaccii]|nr:hypothetical protein SVAN01_01946 [Stagonosporopsis vannaccii]
MFRCIVRHSLTQTSHYILQSSQKAVNHIIVPGSRPSSTLAEAREIKAACTRSDCRCTEGRIESYLKANELKALTASKLRALGAETTFSKYDPLDKQHVTIMESWYTRGPPPLSEYTLTFGKHRGKRLDQVPDVYLVKYMIPRREALHWVFGHHDPLVFEALADFMKRHPELKSQAGSKKTVVREGGIPTPIPRERPGRPRKVVLEDSVSQAKRPRGRPRKD